MQVVTTVGLDIAKSVFQDQCCKREESSCQLGAVHTRHKADMRSANVRERAASVAAQGRPFVSVSPL
jgi:hypothetical protein